MFLKHFAVCALAVGLALATPVQAQETVRVGVTATGVPFTFVDTTTQLPTGAMVDLARAIVEDNAMKPAFELTAFSALVPSLSTHKIDLISAGMLATDERRKVVDFSDPVYTYGEGMFVAANSKDVTIEDLKGETVGAQIGTTFADSLKALGVFGEVKLYESIADIMRDVKLGRIKAGFGDQPIVAYQITKNPDLGIRLVKGYKPLKEGGVALAVAKDNPKLLQQVNASIAKLKANGQLAKIFAAYGL